MTSQSEHKERILTHARERFFKEGFAKISVDELTSELSMSKKTFYQVFESKDDLVMQIVERKMADINARMDLILEQPVDAVTKLHTLVHFMGSTIGAISKTTMADMHRHYPNLWDRIQQYRRERLSRNINLLFEQGTVEGLLRKSVNPRLFLLAYLAAIETIIQPDVIANESFSIKEAIQSLMDIFFRGILTESASIRLNELQQNQTTHLKV